MDMVKHFFQVDLHHVEHPLLAYELHATPVHIRINL